MKNFLDLYFNKVFVNVLIYISFICEKKFFNKVIKNDVKRILFYFFVLIFE